MISIYNTIAIPLIACSLVCVGIVFWYPKYWRDHKISIFGTMSTAIFVWATHINNLLHPVVILVFAIGMLTAISIGDVAYMHKKEPYKGEG